MKIRESTATDVASIAMLISQSNQDVAVKFGLNADNCPKHPSFCTEDWIEADVACGEKYFILEENSAAIGCVAYKNPSAGLAYLNRLSVLPNHRNRGVGARLVQHVMQYARSTSIKTISIGIIGEHTELQRWYGKRGFINGEIRWFSNRSIDSVQGSGMILSYFLCVRSASYEHAPENHHAD
jgi:GNAT superfamily N-acetyltransferase